MKRKQREAEGGEGGEERRGRRREGRGREEGRRGIGGGPYYLNSLQIFNFPGEALLHCLF